MSQPGFLDLFYQHFLASHPDIPPKFAHTDMGKQKELLRHGLSMVLMFAEGSPTAERALQRIGRSHRPGGAVDVPAELYRYWYNSLLTTIEQVDPQYTEEVRKAWAAVLQQAIDFILTHYQTRATG